MVFSVDRVLVDHGLYEVIGSKAPVFSWSAVHDTPDAVQSGCRVVVQKGADVVWDSGVVLTSEQSLRYAGPALESLTAYDVVVTLLDGEGQESRSNLASFLTPLYEDWNAKWIAAEDREGVSPCFRREFSGKDIQRAVLCCCGIGYQSVTINGEPIDDSELGPITSDYTRTCYYTVTDVTDLLVRERNCIGVVLGEGWRRNLGEFLGNNIAPGAARFYGRPQLTALLRLFKPSGAYIDIVTDDKWSCGFGAYTRNNLFDGVTYDARLYPEGFDEAGFEGGFGPVEIVSAPGAEGCFIPDWHKQLPETEYTAPHVCRLLPQTVPPIRVKKEYSAVSCYFLRPGVQILDFGQNLAGRVCVFIPQMEAGQSFSILHAEELGEDGGLHIANLRGAKCTDTYISNGEDAGMLWYPAFTYHGFRYVQVEGYPDTLNDTLIWAQALYTDVDTESYFRCGSADANAMHQLCVMTERANIHGILTDCPQRDERMGWMNDATVRFEETPYNFEVGRLFPKVVSDFMDVQGSDGSVTCTAPFVYGGRPADPVCSSFLVAGLEPWLFGGDTDNLAKAFDAFAGWAECLRSHATDWIVDYTYYGDWAGPADACMSMEDPHSSSTDGILMSTGYLYFNYTLLTRFARALGRTEDEARYAEYAENVKQAMLAKWYHPETAAMDTGSQGAQAFALWLGILPEADRQRAADRLHQAVVDAGMRIMTGNLNTRYLLEMLTEYGYADDALALIERREYPSWGYMIENAATTVWERFEMKLNGGMNSHSHPMFGASDRWFYSHLAGIQPTAPHFSQLVIQPAFPEKLSYAQATVDSPRGKAAVRWHRKYGKTYVAVNLPFNTQATVILPCGTYQQGSGYRLYEF